MITVARTTLFAGALLMAGAAFAQAPAAPPAAAPAAPAAPAAAQPKPIAIKDAAVNGATGIRYDIYYDRYLVSTPTGIATVTGEGKVDNAKFIATDKALGVYVRDAKIYVLDAQGVKVFDLNGKPCAQATCGTTPAKYDLAAVAPTSLAVTSTGVIFVADAGKSAADSALWRIGTDGKATKLVSGAAAKRPMAVEINVNRAANGVSAANYVTGDGSEMVTIDQNGKEIGRIDLKGPKLAGIVATDNGVFIVQGQDGVTYTVDAYGKASKLAEGNTGGTNLTWDHVRNKIGIAAGANGVVLVAGPRVAGF